MNTISKLLLLLEVQSNNKSYTTIGHWQTIRGERIVSEVMMMIMMFLEKLK
jgi:hypothetical protein